MEYLTYFFSWLVPPVFLSRVLRSLIGSPKKTTKDKAAADHRMPRLAAPIVERIHAWERSCISKQKRILSGSSLLCVARKL